MPQEQRGARCAECGEELFVTATGVAHHGTPEEIDYDADGDHVALDEAEIGL